MPTTVQCTTSGSEMFFVLTSREIAVCKRKFETIWQLSLFFICNSKDRYRHTYAHMHMRTHIYTQLTKVQSKVKCCTHLAIEAVVLLESGVLG